MTPEKTLDRDCVFQGGLLRLEVHEVELEDGSRSQRELIFHPGAVCAVVLTTEQRVVLVRQYRKAVEAPLLEIPAGKLDGGEDPDAAILRELREEVGFQSGQIRRLIDFYLSPGFCDEKLTLYLATEAVLGEPQWDDGEFLELMFVTRDEALDLALVGQLGDAKSALGILMAARLNWE